MSDFLVVQDIYKTGHVIFEGSEAEVYIYLKRWNFSEASMVWVQGGMPFQKIGSTAWFNAARRKLIRVEIEEVLAIGVYDTESPGAVEIVDQYTDKILEII